MPITQVGAGGNTGSTIPVSSYSPGDFLLCFVDRFDDGGYNWAGNGWNEITPWTSPALNFGPDAGGWRALTEDDRRSDTRARGSSAFIDRA